MLYIGEEARNAHGETRGGGGGRRSGGGSPRRAAKGEGGEEEEEDEQQEEDREEDEEGGGEGGNKKNSLLCRMQKYIQDRLEKLNSQQEKGWNEIKTQISKFAEAQEEAAKKRENQAKGLCA